MSEPGVLTEVPPALKRLAQQVVRGFYGVEHSLALDVLIRNPCVREEDMLTLLQFERKQLRSVLNTLKNDKFLKCRLRVETAADGKTTRHNYYFINYRLLVNVVKYKLDHMRRRIETDERDNTNRASFRCPCCMSTFTDLEANQLFDPMTGTFRCTYCQTEVEEDEGAAPKKDARTLLARFNEQIEPVYGLLRQTDDINLSHDLLEPEPCEIPALKQSRERAAAAAQGSAPHREAWASTGRASYADLYTQQVEINMETGDEAQRRSASGSASATTATGDAAASAKQRPVWLTQSTVQGAYNESDALTHSGADAGAAPADDGQARGLMRDQNEEVMRALLIHEKRAGGAAAPNPRGHAPHVPAANNSDSDSDTSESEDEGPGPGAGLGAGAAASSSQPMEDEDEEEEFEEVGEESMVYVGGKAYSYSEVSQRPELVERMSSSEKEAYIEMGRNLYQDMYF
ncbi:general transcription factor IIE subunit 1 [Engraulis encrasicolus]|uniref:general transcription factor IIE subunit 1 n=1 Tax=Engraulis encrasicolus TaxID=184585 RepID=UPI002FD64564